MHQAHCAVTTTDVVYCCTRLWQDPASFKILSDAAWPGWADHKGREDLLGNLLRGVPLLYCFHYALVKGCQ